MGLGQIDIVEPDLVEDSNRNRQHFTARDVGRPKAHQLLKNLAPYAVKPTLLRGFHMTFEDWVKEPQRQPYSVITCGVDSFLTMVAVARYALSTRTPAVFYNVSADGEACRIFIQRSTPEDPCFACYFPQVMDPTAFRNRPCIPTPAIGDILQVAVGFATRALVGEVLGVPIGDYHSRDITFGGVDIKKTIAKQPACTLCAR
jgi:molybdopterin/thiamine biosynthesis adenylyltransferase